MSRLFLVGGASVIRKEPLGPQAVERLRHEKAVLQRLTGVPGVVPLADAQPDPHALLLRDVRGVHLADMPTPLPVADLTRLAVQLARIVAAIHRRGVIHRDINPGNILLVGPRPAPYLVGFELAMTFAEIRPEFTHHTEIIGTLPYIAPEQTGRTGRPVDQRADLYALGATLYEAATGTPPFGTGDPLRLSHDHLARIPDPPTSSNPAIPPALSDVILHLLEKEPDNRYQSAEGLIYDLGRLHREGISFRIGEHDFPVRLRSPSRLVARDREISALSAAFTGALSGRCRGVLISGAPGVGKSSLVDELRPVVTAKNGWFVSGKFDQYRRDQEFDAVRQAFRALGRLLLAEPEAELSELRERMLKALGSNAGLVTAVVPEMAMLLQVPPEAGGDPLTKQVRAQRNAITILRAVASPERPVVFVVDDLQWGSQTPLGFLDLAMSEEPIDGLLLVAAYREADIDATHPLTSMLSRWRRQPMGLNFLRLENLPPASLTTMITDMLRLDAGRAGDLAKVIAPHTKGNPYDTVELLNSLRHDGALIPTHDGWQWDATALRHRLHRTAVADLLTDRADAMPPETRQLLSSMALLGGRAETALLSVAAGLPVDTVQQRLAPALDDGLLALEPGAQEAVRFRHDRVQEAMLLRLEPNAQRDLRLDLARRLATHPELSVVAAEQYLPVADEVRDRQERERAVHLLRHAADEATMLSNHTVVDRHLAAAERLIEPTDTATLIQVHTGRHTALYSLGRLAEADEIYQRIAQLSDQPIERTEATLVQVSSLTNQGRPREAVDLGVGLLRQLGFPVPDQPSAEVEHHLDAIYRWLDETSIAEDLRRPEITDPYLLATAALINRLMPPAFFSDQTMMAWLSLAAWRMWAEHGPGRTLVGPASHIAFVTAPMRQDYRTGYRLMRRLLAVSEARGYEPDSSQAQFLYALGTSPWFESLEENLPRALRAREGLIKGGDLQNACWTYYVSVYELIDYAPSLDDYATEVDSALDFARRTGNAHAADMFRAYRRLVSGLRGESTDTSADGAPYLDTDNLAATAVTHVARAIAAAVFGDCAELARQSAAAMPLLRHIGPAYPTAIAHLLRGLSLADQARAATGDDRRTLLDELAAVIDWLAAHVEDTPVNYQHLLRLLEAERAWATGDFPAAVYAFDLAQREAAGRQRPWHRALITERAGRFYLAHGVEHAGHRLLTQASAEYLAWGATAKVAQLGWAYPALQAPPAGGAVTGHTRPADRAAYAPGLAAGSFDLLGILSASQALSSETAIEGLRTRLVEVLSAMTGATGVHLLVREEEGSGWLLTAAGGEGGTRIPLDQAIQARLVPGSALRYVERTREPLVVANATRDDRFARDPYLAGLDCCSLLVIPILNRGAPRALLQLENRLIRGAFSTDRLDSVMLIAGQLAVSLDNAMVYASLERKVAERTHDLAVANQRLEQLSVTDALTGLANRRQLEDVLRAEWCRAQTTATPIALAMIDIDYFKLYNDRYGHTAGDKCLQRIAALLKNNIRATDLVARYGGEEFAVVMPRTDLNTALQVADRLHLAVVTLAERHPLAPEQVVTVSIGAAAVTPSSQETVGHLMELADAQLYWAKRKGRNRVWPHR